MKSITHDTVRGDARFGGLVKRYHEWPVTREQNVAEHSWQVIRIFMEIWPPHLSPPENYVQILMYIHRHDVGELGTGDPPFPTKRDHPEFKKQVEILEHESLIRQNVVLPSLAPYDLKRVKCCDLLEMYEYGLEEIMRGNSYCVAVCKVTFEGVERTASDLMTEDAHRVLRKLRSYPMELWRGR